MSKVLAHGIDVSTHQGRIDWAKVKASGMAEFVIIRIGYRGYAKSGIIKEDKWFKHNIEGAIANGIEHIFTYFFSTSLNENEGAEEGRWCLDKLEPYKDKIEPVIVFDYEGWKNTNYRTHGISKEQRTANYKAFTEVINAAGYENLVYSSKYYLKEKFDIDDIDELIWMAAYPPASKIDPDNPPIYNQYLDRLAIWQYTKSDKADGINTKVDLNYMYIDIFNDKTDNNPYSMPARTLYLGNSKMTEEDIKWLQWKLKEDGYDIEIDGVFTKTTAAILRDYQFNHGLEVDGKCGPATKKDMKANYQKNIDN